MKPRHPTFGTLADAVLYGCLFISLGWKIALAIILLHWFTALHWGGIVARWRVFRQHYVLAQRYAGTKRRAAWIAWKFTRAFAREQRADFGETVW